MGDGAGHFGQDDPAAERLLPRPNELIRDAHNGRGPLERIKIRKGPNESRHRFPLLGEYAHHVAHFEAGD